MDVSLVIPTHNRRRTLIATLDALCSVCYPSGRWEVIVVDDGSKDGSSEAVHDLAVAGALPISCLSQPPRGPAAARNRGARAARGAKLIFLDDDIRVGADFVSRHVAALDANPGCWIVGRVVQRPEMRQTPFGRYREARWESFHSAHPGAGVSETEGMGAANLSLPGADFEKLGGFDEEVRIASCEDMILGIKARAAGIRVLYDPGIVGVHDDWAVTLESFCERQRLYAISDVLLFRRLGQRSPRLAVIRRNGPLRWREDGPSLSLKKLVKGFLSSPPLRATLTGAAKAIEQLAPDTRLSHGLYEAAIAVSISRGVREGFRLHPVRRSDPSP